MSRRQLMRSRSLNALRAGPVGLAIVLLAAALPAGCGSSDPARTSTATDAAATRAAVAEREAEYPQAIAAAVAACRQGVDTGTWLSRGDKKRLYAVCNYGLRRGLTEIRTYGLQVCREVVFTSSAKTAAERSQLFARCYANAKQKTAAIE
jgi:hypothetical protein